MNFCSSGARKASIRQPSYDAPTDPRRSISSCARAMAMSSCSIAPGPPQPAYGPPDLPQGGRRGRPHLLCLRHQSGDFRIRRRRRFPSPSISPAQANLAVAYDTNYRARLWPPARARDVIHEAVRRARYVFVEPGGWRGLDGDSTSRGPDRFLPEPRPGDRHPEAGSCRRPAGDRARPPASARRRRWPRWTAPAPAMCWPEPSWLASLPGMTRRAPPATP